MTIPYVHGNLAIASEIIHGDVGLHYVGDSIAVGNVDWIMLGFRPDLWGGWSETVQNALGNPVGGTWGYWDPSVPTIDVFGKSAYTASGYGVGFKWTADTAQGSGDNSYTARRVYDSFGAGLNLGLRYTNSFGRQQTWYNVGNPDTEQLGIFLTDPASPDGKIAMATYFTDDLSIPVARAVVNLNGAAGYTRSFAPMTKGRILDTGNVVQTVATTSGSTMLANEGFSLLNTGIWRADRRGLRVSYGCIGGTGPAFWTNPALFSDQAIVAHLDLLQVTHVAFALTTNSPGNTAQEATDLASALVERWATLRPGVHFVVFTGHPLGQVSQQAFVRDAWIEIANSRNDLLLLDVNGALGGSAPVLADALWPNAGDAVHVGPPGKLGTWHMRQCLMEAADQYTRGFASPHQKRGPIRVVQLRRGARRKGRR